MYLDTTTSTSGGDAFLSLIYLVIGVALYFLPSIVANRRHTLNASAVLVINLFLGWTVLGWIVALAMAAGTTKDKLKASAPQITVTGSAPVISPDGASWWDGKQWQPLPSRPEPPATP